MDIETDQIIEELFKSFLQRYWEGFKESMKGIKFIFDKADLLYHYLQKIKLNKKGGSYIDSPKWLKNKKEPINRKDYDVNCFQYAITAALNHKQTKSHPERLSNLKSFIDQYNSKERDFH